MQPEEVPTWPVADAIVRDDGSAEVTIHGATRPINAETPEEARAALIEVVRVELAATAGRAVRLTTVDPDGAHGELAISPDGSVSELARTTRPASARSQPPATPTPLRVADPTPPPRDDLPPAASAPRPAPVAIPAPDVPVAPRPRRTAQDITSERMVRAETEPPQRGWRRALYQVSGGAINLGLSSSEVAERDLIARVKTPVAGCRRIAVVSRKGGVGKTTTTLMLGHTLATHRGDRVIALDGNPDAGSLGYRVRRETTTTISNLLTQRQHIQRYADIRAYTSQAVTRLEVVAGDDDPRITDALIEQDFFAAVDLLEHHYNLICMDTGTGVLESAAKGILALADQIIVVTEPSLDSARAASSTLDWLDKNHYAHLVESGVAVINAIPQKSRIDLTAIEQHFADRCRTVIHIPWDAHLEVGAESSPDHLTANTRTAYLKLSAAVADGFAADPVARHKHT